MTASRRPRRPERQRIENRSCFYCGQVGHIVRDCPARWGNVTDDSQRPDNRFCSFCLRPEHTVTESRERRYVAQQQPTRNTQDDNVRSNMNGAGAQPDFRNDSRNRDYFRDRESRVPTMQTGDNRTAQRQRPYRPNISVMDIESPAVPRVKNFEVAGMGSRKSHIIDVQRMKPMPSKSSLRKENSENGAKSLRASALAKREGNKEQASRKRSILTGIRSVEGKGSAPAKTTTQQEKEDDEMKGEAAGSVLAGNESMTPASSWEDGIQVSRSQKAPCNLVNIYGWLISILLMGVFFVESCQAEVMCERLEGNSSAGVIGTLWNNTRAGKGESAEVKGKILGSVSGSITLYILVIVLYVYLLAQRIKVPARFSTGVPWPWKRIMVTLIPVNDEIDDTDAVAFEAPEILMNATPFQESSDSLVTPVQTASSNNQTEAYNSTM